MARIADHLAARRTGHPLRVGVDGITAAGKTTLADELAGALGALGRPAVRVSMDGFHHPRARRYVRGRESAEGYYRDAYDLESFADLVLVPLGPDGDRRYAEAILDLDRDTPVEEWAYARPDAVVVVDGSFLQRGELRALWDEVVFVDTPYELARERGAVRDAERFGGIDEARRLFDTRYHAASHLYEDEIDPRSRATIVVTNAEPGEPFVQRIGGAEDARIALFAYGTLCQAEVQLASFGRLLEGSPDLLRGFAADFVSISDPAVIRASGSDRHPIASMTGAAGDVVEGTCFAIGPHELAAADRYEVEDYRRILVRLGSGTEAWVYVAGGRGPPRAGPTGASATRMEG